MIGKKIKPILNVIMHPESDYSAYLKVLSDVKAGIRMTKRMIAEEKFGERLEKLSSYQYKELNHICGIKIMEAEITL